MNERQMEHLEELKRWLTNTIGDYGYTDKYEIETTDHEDYTEAEVTITIPDPSEGPDGEKEVCLNFSIYEDNININKYEDNFEEIDYSNYGELIWRQLFFEK